MDNKITFDGIFKKSNDSLEKKEAKKLFGRLLISLRKNNHINLYSLLDSCNDVDLSGGTIKLYINDKTSLKLLSDNSNVAILEKEFSAMGKDIKVALEFNGVEELDVYKFETFLKDEFGKILVIKK